MGKEKDAERQEVMGGGDVARAREWTCSRVFKRLRAPAQNSAQQQSVVARSLLRGRPLIH